MNAGIAAPTGAARTAGGAVLLDGKAVAARVRAQVAQRAAEFARRHGRPPGLAVVQVGEDPASSVYVRNKRSPRSRPASSPSRTTCPPPAARRRSSPWCMPLNHDERVDGILVQLPLPKGVSADRIMDAVDPAKDVDGFHPVNTGLLAQKRPRLRPCTPFGVIRLAQEYGIGLTGLRATVVGASNIVGRPDGARAAAGARHRHGLPHRNAGAARRGGARGTAGRGRRQGRLHPRGVGTPRGRGVRCGHQSRKRRPPGGDVGFEAAAARAGWITPVPGGLGPMTIAMLLSNAVDAAYLRARG